MSFIKERRMKSKRKKVKREEKLPKQGWLEKRG